MKLTFPGISDADFQDAFRVLQEAIVTKLPTYGFTRPFMGPGGVYGGCWWERDTALALSGYQWLDQKFCEDVLRNFCDVQKENGRIPLWGADRVPEYDEQLSAIPVLFEVAGSILERSTDTALVVQVYSMLCRYMAWWRSALKTDEKTLLTCGIFEESDPCDNHTQKAVAQVDLNVQLVVGFGVLSHLAGRLGRPAEAGAFTAAGEALKQAINRWLYCEEDGAYHSLLLPAGTLDKRRLYNTTFDVTKAHILPPERAARLFGLLTDTALFQWASPYALTTLAHGCAEYVETTGTYQGYPSWMGNIWTLRNVIIVTGLREYGRYDLSSVLALKTVRAFNGNYAEFLSPADGRGHGVQRYCWSASQYLQLLIEELFGVCYSAVQRRVNIMPNLPPELKGQTLLLEDLPISSAGTLSLKLHYADRLELSYHFAPAASADALHFRVAAPFLSGAVHESVAPAAAFVLQ